MFFGPLLFLALVSPNFSQNSQELLDNVTLSEGNEINPPRILLIGGLLAPGSIELFNPSQPNLSFEFNVSLLTPRYGHVSGYLPSQNLAIVAGGRQFSTREYLKLVESFNPETLELKSLKSMKLQRHYAAASVLDSEMFVCGGLDAFQKFLPSCEKFQNWKWRYVATMHYPRYGLAMANLDGNIFAVGGPTAHSYLQAVEEYDTVYDRWKIGAKLHSIRTGFAAAGIDQLLVVCGGFDGSKEFEMCEKFDPKAATWRVMADLVNKRSFSTMVNARNRLYIFGGKEENVTKSIEIYDATAEKWQDLEFELIRERYRHSVVVLE